ncbi:hypothetical protein D9757_007416 [Collybiopsis confluens]|uniref:Uncharacterized protein n=1 Tax=Collybiopsis confluens TaxID=2823264 RepID=A0A8H5M7S2_9AGAR|nr:hypothetical protein D9757_007416 [Collybiopsis confluens]
MRKSQKNALFSRIALQLHTQPSLARLLADPLLFRRPKIGPASELQNLFGAMQCPLVEALRQFKQWFQAQPRQSSLISSALEDAESRKTSSIAKRRRIGEKLHLNPNSSRSKIASEILWNGVRVIKVSRLCRPYPTIDCWIVETKEIWHKWYRHIYFGKQPDKRIRRRKMKMVDSRYLQEDLAEDESALYVDCKTEILVGGAIRNTCESRKILRYIQSVVAENTADRISVRKEDAGVLAIAGWCAGSRSRTTFDWVKNLLGTQSKEQKMEYEYRAASAFALFWNMVKSLGPEEVRRDLEAFASTDGLYRMDSAIWGGGREQQYSVMLDEEELLFQGADMAPPSGVFGRNYARFVHRERQPHRWSVSWTTYRLQSSGTELGGHFYLCNWGIRIRAATSTMVFWKPEEWHGTSLPNMVPHEDTLISDGMAIVTSNRLPGAFKKFWEGTISYEELVKLERKIAQVNDEVEVPVRRKRVLRKRA